MKVASIQTDACVACGVCAKTCPRGAVTIFKGCHAVVDESRCVGCMLCARACPASVITKKEATT